MLRERRRHAHYKLNSRLDRKSSRGMIYENEELRLRTININAEVERGQSDIKRLRRENEQLRREIWTLRDECDKLHKRVNAKFSDHEYRASRGSGGSGGTCHAYRCSGGGGGRGSGGCDVNSDGSDSCDTCRGVDDGHCSDECCQEGGSCAPLKPPLPPEVPRHPSPARNEDQKSQNKEQQQPMHFDHLSVVSEETLSNPELLLAQHQEHLMICTPDPNGSQSTLPSMMGPLTPLTPIELVANQLNDLQATVPPLSYFENILSQHLGGRNAALTPSPELGTSSSTTTGKTMRHTNGWDYNLQSPFTQRKYSNQSSPSCSPPPPPPPVSTMTTFVPTASQQTMPKIALNAPPHLVVDSGDIQTVAITTNATQQALNSPKHFFAPIKPRLKLNTKLANQGQGLEPEDLPPGSPPPPLRDPPDIFVNNALASPYQRRVSPQTDSVNLESILNDIETISEDILAIQLEKSKSRDNLSQNQNKDDDRTKKPYRSEMNLYLQYDGTNPTISPATTETEMGTATTTVPSTSESGHSGTGSWSGKLMRRTRSLEREHTDSPAPHIPDPMAPFPDKCTYLGFDQVNQAAGVPPPSPNGPRPPIATKPNVPLKPPPPLPPARRPTMPTEPPPPPPTTSAGGIALQPNKSQLYKSLASAAAKRAIFRSSPSQLTRSLDVDLTGAEAAGENGEQVASGDLDELARRKARRVSIVCGSGQSGRPDEVATPVTTAPTATASCVDLSSVLTHPSVKAFKMSHSTPNSPHSSRRRTNSNTMAAPLGAAGGGHPEVQATASAPPSTSHHHHHRKEGSDPVPMTATVSRTKCSRRHSEGTVHTGHRNSSASGGGGGGHHHHHSHHHPHSGMAISSNPHHSHHSHQDSNHETVTSQSDRNSNSFASSRESSTSFSMRSTRRKISISSHTGGKIPWCGCWGNGCL
ncbi:serine/threonine-protein kinase ste20 isoform X4 [Drosophila serrata]|uniref:serine/threonine-protein kinase ste20 isoform X4 n=1 Tax=Drosophila serrata TaxID=7274 RepID=UPI000A1D2DB6|nr:serine/threonine-protein kinase ste20 isoform X4 [Drosophila serrata]